MKRLVESPSCAWRTAVGRGDLRRVMDQDPVAARLQCFRDRAVAVRVPSCAASNGSMVSVQLASPVPRRGRAACGPPAGEIVAESTRWLEAFRIDRTEVSNASFETFRDQSKTFGTRLQSIR